MSKNVFGDLDPFIKELKKDVVPFDQGAEKVLGYTVLEDGRKAQITVKLNACKDEWIRD